MQTQIELPKAFSVRDDHEFCNFQNLATRLNPKLLVAQAATGVHVNGGPTVFWGIVYEQDRSPTKREVEAALREAGFDFAHNVLVQSSSVSPCQWGGDGEADAL
jgi:hypothetical protein